MRKLGALAIAVVGLAIIANALSMFGNSSWLFQSMSYLSDWLSVLGTLIGVALMAAFGYWLIVKRESLAARLFDDSDLSLQVDAPSLLRVALIVIGILLLLVSAPRVIGIVSSAITISASVSSPEYGFAPGTFPWWEVVGSAVMIAIELAIGVLLVWRSASVATWLWNLGVLAEDVSSQVETCASCGAAFDPADYRDRSSALCHDCGAPLFPGSV